MILVIQFQQLWIKIHLQAEEAELVPVKESSKYFLFHGRKIYGRDFYIEIIFNKYLRSNTVHLDLFNISETFPVLVTSVCAKAAELCCFVHTAVFL